MSDPYGIHILRRDLERAQAPHKGMHVGLPKVVVDASHVAHALAAYDALASRLAEAERALAAARRSNQDAADLLLTINRDMHARNPTAVTAIDMWLAERGCDALSPRHQSAEGAEGEGR